jgi:hypothetical protein
LSPAFAPNVRTLSCRRRSTKREKAVLASTIQLLALFASKMRKWVEKPNEVSQNDNIQILLFQGRFDTILVGIGQIREIALDKLVR